ncbi:MAG: DinB family protein [Caldilineaceae bacterium]|nr:DinB family protein [Caldilineaceae bacterium]
MTNDQTARQANIAAIGALPGQVAALTAGLTAEQLTTPYDKGEWTIAQNVHHLCDSHINSYIRCKLIATEERPPLKPYDQDAWARFPDAEEADMAASLALLGGLHSRWVLFWQTLPDDAWARTGVHPESGAVSLDEQLRLYAEHGRAHLAQMQRVMVAGGIEA